MVNNCVLVGRIATDPEMRYTASGMAVVNFRIAVNRRQASKDGQDADFLDIVAFGKSGEFVAQYLDKGSLVGVEGRIQSRNWQTNDGQKRTSVEIVANNVQALESRQEAERRRAAKGVSGPPNAAAQAPPPAAAAPAAAAPAAAAPAAAPAPAQGHAQPAQPQAPPPAESQGYAEPAQPQAPPPAAPMAQPPMQSQGPIADDEDPFADQ